MARTDDVRRNRENWFREIPGGRHAYRTDPQVRITVDSVDAALSGADRAMQAEAVPDDVRRRVLHQAVFGIPNDLEGVRRRAEERRLAAEQLETEKRVTEIYDTEKD